MFINLNKFVRIFKIKQHVKLVSITIETHFDLLTTNFIKYFTTSDNIWKFHVHKFYYSWRNQSAIWYRKIHFFEFWGRSGWWIFSAKNYDLPNYHLLFMRGRIFYNGCINDKGQISGKSRKKTQDCQLIKTDPRKYFYVKVNYALIFTI